MYLSCAEIAAPVAKMAIDAEMLRLISELLFIVASPSSVQGRVTINDPLLEIASLHCLPRLRTAPPLLTKIMITA
jgi:hypothetical protein